MRDPLVFALKLVVVVIVGFIVLPAVVVMIASVNDKAILSFPPQELSLRWYTRALTYRDFQEGMKNGAIVTAFASAIALVVGAAFAYVIDRYEFRGKALLEGTLMAPLVVPHFVVGLGFLTALTTRITVLQTLRDIDGRSADPGRLD